MNHLADTYPLLIPGGGLQSVYDVSWH